MVEAKPPAKGDEGGASALSGCCSLVFSLQPPRNTYNMTRRHTDSRPERSINRDKSFTLVNACYTDRFDGSCLKMSYIGHKGSIKIGSREETDSPLREWNVENRFATKMSTRSFNRYTRHIFFGLTFAILFDLA